MLISREQVKKVFKDYTDKYDSSDGKIKLKIDHTYRVADLCERIAESLSLSDDDINLAWLLGMLHDIGRFEQLRRYGTFSDAQSIDHAHFGVELLYEGMEYEKRIFHENGKIFLDQFVDISKEEEAFWMIAVSIWNHSAYRIEEGLDERSEMFCHILRDADKVDIFRVCQDTPLEVIYNVTKEEVQNADVTEEVMKQFFEKHAVLRSVKRTPADHLAGHAALAFELVYPESLRIAREQGYLKKILEFEFENERTNEQFRKLKDFMEEYLDKQSK